MHVVFPTSVEELSEILTEASEKKTRIIPVGAATWLLPFTNKNDDGLIVSTRDMNRIIAYEPADLTAIVQAGVTLQNFNKIAAGHGQMIPLDPFGNDQSTLGAIISTGSYGPLRCAYGTPRDWLIGIKVVHADGRITKAGGNVVKNVAGYDLCKLYTGSYGTLAVITEMSFKLRALPASEKSLIVFSDNIHDLCDLVSRISKSDLLPASCELIFARNNTHNLKLALRFLDEIETIDAQIKIARVLGHKFKTSTKDITKSKDFWIEYHKSENNHEYEVEIRITCLPSDLEKTLSNIDHLLPHSEWRAHAANGVIRVFTNITHLESITKLRLTIQRMGGQLIILTAPPSLLDKIEAWGKITDTGARKLMIEIKKSLDPQNILPQIEFSSAQKSAI